MTAYFINMTNHPAENWSPEQKAAAEKYGEIVNLPFPAVDPQWSETQVEAMAEKYAKSIAGQKPRAVLCQGEMSLCYAVVRQLQKRHILVLAACSRRHAKETTQKDGSTRRISYYSFVQFRAYPAA